MKREKLRGLIREVLTEREALGHRPMTYDTLSVDFQKRTVRFHGRTIGPIREKAVEFPVLSIDRIIITKDGSDVL